MKTNQERSKIILQRYKNLSTTQGIENNKESSKQKVFTTKFWLSIACAMVVVVSSILGLVFGLKGRDNNGRTFNLDNMYIANFASYTALGAAESATVQTNSVMMSKSSNAEKYMVGLKENGEVEEIKVSKTEGGQGEEIKWNLVYMQSYTNFTIASYSYLSDNNFSGFAIYEACRTIIIDNHTGKIYSLDELHEFGKPATNIGIYGDMSNKTYNPYPFYADGFESDDALYFHTEQINGPQIFYKATIENGDLKITKIFEISDNSTMVEITPNETFVDKHNNIYLKKRDTGVEYNTFYQYVITSEGLLKSLNKEIVLSINGYVYTADGSHYINAQGELVENTFANYNLFVRKDSLIKKDGNTEYYYDGGANITKVIWTNDIEYSYEKIAIETLDVEKSFKYVATADKIFFMQEQTLFYVNITDGIKNELVSEYFFTSIDTDNLGNVVFVALNTEMATIKGIIKNDNTIDINVEEKQHTIYYIKALNVSN